MKKLIILSALLFLISFISCTKRSSNATTDSITYEVILTNCTTWSGSYLDETAALTNVANQTTNWKLTFTNKAGKPRSLMIASVPIGTNANVDATVNIYVNGTKVKTADMIINGLAQAVYNLK